MKSRSIVCPCPFLCVVLPYLLQHGLLGCMWKLQWFRERSMNVPYGFPTDTERSKKWLVHVRRSNLTTITKDLSNKKNVRSSYSNTAFGLFHKQNTPLEKLIFGLLKKKRNRERLVKPRERRRRMRGEGVFPFQGVFRLH